MPTSSTTTRGPSGGCSPRRTRARSTVRGGRSRKRAARSSSIEGFPGRADAVPAHREPPLQGADLRAQRGRPANARRAERLDRAWLDRLADALRRGARADLRAPGRAGGARRARQHGAGRGGPCRMRRWCPTRSTSTAPRTVCGRRLAQRLLRPRRGLDRDARRRGAPTSRAARPARSSSRSTTPPASCPRAPAPPSTTTAASSSTSDPSDPSPVPDSGRPGRTMR